MNEIPFSKYEGFQLGYFLQISRYVQQLERYVQTPSPPLSLPWAHTFLNAKLMNPMLLWHLPL